MDGAFPLSAQIAEAKAAGTALWHRDGEQLAASRESHEGFFDAVSRLARLPLIPGPGSVLIRSGEAVLGAAGASGASGDDDRACVEAGLRAVFPGFDVHCRGVSGVVDPACMAFGRTSVRPDGAADTHQQSVTSSVADNEINGGNRDR